MDFSNIEKIFKISSADSLSYKPIKVIRKIISPKFDAIMTQQVVVFVGNSFLDKNVKSILQKIEKNPKASLTKQDINVLKQEYGNNFAKILQLPVTGGGDPDILSEEDDDEFDEMEDVGLDLDLDSNEEEVKTVSESKSSDFGLKYVYDYINIDDDIDTIKRKIEIHLKIPIEAQHNWYTFTRDNKSKYTKLLDYQCRTVLSDTMSYLYPVAIDTILNVDSKKILGLSVDNEFIRGYKQKAQLHILNFTNNILGDKYYSGFEQENTINVLNLYSVLSTIGVGKIQSLRNDDYNSYESFYYGIILKYWPMVKLIDLSTILTKGQFPDISSNYKLYEKMYLDKQYYINLINSIDVKDITKIFEINSGITGFDFTINKTFSNLFSSDILKLADVYNNFPISNDIPFISYYAHGMKEPKYKYNTSESEYFSEYQIEKWTQNMLNGIIFKVRMVLKKDSPLYDYSFMTVELNSRGKLNIKITWKEGYTQDDFDYINLRSFYDIINKLIDKINSSPKTVFIKNINIPEVDESRSNVTFQFINLFSRILFKSKETSLNYKILRTLVNVFRSHAREAQPKKNRRGQTQNETKLLYTRKSKYHRFPKSKQLNQFLIDQSKINTIEPKGIYIYISEAIKNEPKISIHGIKDFDEFKYTHDFLIRLIYIALNLKEFLKKKGTEQFKNDYKKLISMREKDINVKDDKNVETYYATKKKELTENIKKSSIDANGKINTQFKKIKLLKAYNRKLFGYKKTDKYESYSRLCQNEKQPIPMTDAELEKYRQKTVNGKVDALKYPSNDPLVQPVNYICTHSLYKYPGFIPPDKHPSNQCLPCCFINDSIKNTRSKNSKTYNMCLGKDNENKDEQIEISQKYIKQYTKFIMDGRLSNPPYQLNRFLNETKIGENGKIEFKGERRNRRNIYESDRRGPPTYLLLGVPQHNRSFLTAVETALDIPRGQLLSELIDLLKKKGKIVFDTLSSGNLKRRFGTMEKYIEHINNPSTTITANEIEDLITRLNKKYPDDLSIHILYEDNNGGIQLRCTSSKNTVTGNNHIVIFNTGQYYYPIVLVGNPDLPSKMVEKVFKTNSKIIVIINDLFNKMCDTEKSKVKFAETNINLPLTEMYNVLKKMDDSISIKYQYVNQNNYVIGLVIEPKKGADLFTLPILISDPMKGIPVTQTYHYGNWKTVYPFLLKLSDTLGTGSTSVINKLIVDSSEKYLVGVVLRYKLELYINKVPLNLITVGAVKKLKRKIQTINLESINKLIKEPVIIKDQRVANVIDIKYDQELYDLVKYEVNNVLFNERNTEKRAEILKIQSKLDTTTNIELLKLVPEDYNRLKELLRVTGYFAKNDNNSLKLFESYFKKYTFYFDLLTINKIESILNQDINLNEKKKLINAIIEKILNNIIIITKPKDKKIETPCSDSKCKTGYCAWDTKTGKCKVILESKNVYNSIINRMLNEIIYNISARNELLKIKLSW
jgi:hypothetical protein